MCRHARQDATHFGNEVALIGAKDRRIVEPGDRTPAMRDHAATANAKIGAGMALIGEHALLAIILVERLAFEKILEWIV